MALNEIIDYEDDREKRKYNRGVLRKVTTMWSEAKESEATIIKGGKSAITNKMTKIWHML